MHRPTDCHHILPKSRDGTQFPNNLKRLPIKTHEAIHRVFDNKTPPEQIRHLLSLYSTALTKDVQSDIIQILDVNDIEYWYKKGVHKFNPL